MRSFPPAPTFGHARHGFAALLFTALGLATTPAFADYKLQSGDALEIAVMGAPGLKQRSLIGVEGDISLPLVGQVKVGGLSVAAAAAKITRDLSTKVYRETTTDGREIPHLIMPDEVVVSVAEYRPIYVNGDVAKPGAYAFRPGITVRQVLAVAGGYGLPSLGVGNPYLQSADLTAEYQTLWTEYAQERDRAWRLRSELGEQAVKPTDTDTPIPAGVSERLMKSETEQYNARIADREEDAAFLQSAFKKADLQLSTLAAKKKADEEGNRADMNDSLKIRDLYNRGLATVTRLSEARRAALLSSDQLLQTIVEMAALDRQRGEYARELAKAGEQFRIDNLKELQKSEARLVQITASLKSTGEKLAYMGQLKSQLTQKSGGGPTVTVYRKGDQGPEHFTAADEDQQLVPGDVVDVSQQNSRVSEIRMPSEKDAATVAENGSRLPRK